MCFLFAKLKCSARLRVLQVFLWHVETRRPLGYLGLHRDMRLRCACRTCRLGAPASII